VFVKLANGSSGAGSVAMMSDGRRVRAISTVEWVQHNGECRLYNTRRLRRYESLSDVAALVDWICREGAQVEEWVPKANAPEGTFDLRVLVIAGEVRQTVMRVSETPMTNLHLLNRRGDVEKLKQEVEPEDWRRAMETCRLAASLFPRCLHAGVDLAFLPHHRRHVVFEINAFGDLLPGVLCDGLDTYETEIMALTKRGAA
jgi:hypothetical protein